MRYLILLLLVAPLVACGDSAPAGRALQFVGEPRITTSSGGFFQAEGRVKNTHASQPYTGNIGVTLFDAEGKIVGTAQTSVFSLPPGEEITYIALGRDAPPTWTKIEQKITLERPD